MPSAPMPGGARPGTPNSGAPTSSPVPPETVQRRAALQALRLLRRHGHQALWVGGCGRDLLLGRQPADYDVATSATPEEVMRIFPRTYAVGAQFGVVLVPLGALGGEDAQGGIEVAAQVAALAAAN